MNKLKPSSFGILYEQRANNAIRIQSHKCISQLPLSTVYKQYSLLFL